MKALDSRIRGNDGGVYVALFHSSKRVAICRELLVEAIKSKSAEDVEWSLIVGFIFDFTEQHLEALLLLVSAPWHFKHEDVVTALGQLKTPKAVEALFAATQWIPDYLDFDESRALAVKAI